MLTTESAAAGIERMVQKVIDAARSLTRSLLYSLTTSLIRRQSQRSNARGLHGGVGEGRLRSMRSLLIVDPDW